MYCWIFHKSHVRDAKAFQDTLGFVWKHDNPLQGFNPYVLVGIEVEINLFSTSIHMFWDAMGL